jgi:cellulose synthase/poly-beta-1,6-N-acetylglucosamine synthase-like glycosyltransferase
VADALQPTEKVEFKVLERANNPVDALVSSQGKFAVNEVGEHSGLHFKVSIVIPARNEEKNLAALLLSLKALDFPTDSREIIVVDHVSSDNTRAVAAGLGARVLTTSGATISSVRNFGAAAASGEILAFVDADCTVTPDWLRTALPYFSDCRVGLVGSHYIIPTQPSTLVRKVRLIQARTRPDLIEGAWVPAGNMLIRREVFNAHGGFNESLVTCEDVDICYRIARTHRVIADKRIGCYHEGEPQTLRELFRKELWRGRSNYQGIWEHGIVARELPSLILPIYFLCSLLGFLASLLQGIWTGVMTWATVWCGAAFFIPLFAVAVRMSLHSRQPRYVLHCMVFYGTYFLARSLSPLYTWKHA